MVVKVKIYIQIFLQYISEFPADLVTFTEGILNGKLHFLYSDNHEDTKNCANKYFKVVLFITLYELI